MDLDPDAFDIILRWLREESLNSYANIQYIKSPNSKNKVKISEHNELIEQMHKKYILELSD